MKNAEKVVNHILEIPGGLTLVIGKDLKETKEIVEGIMKLARFKIGVDQENKYGVIKFTNGHRIVLGSIQDIMNYGFYNATGLYVKHHELLDEHKLSMLECRLRNDLGVIYGEDEKPIGYRYLKILD